MDRVYSGDVSGLVGRDLTSGDFNKIGNAIGAKDLPGGTEFTSGGNVYKVSDTGRGTRTLSMVSPEEIANRRFQQERKRALEAIQPAIGSLEEQIPEIQQKYANQQSNLEARREPLEQRYQNLIESIKGDRQAETTSAIRTSNQEFARRGLSGTSTGVQEEQNRITQGIAEAFNRLLIDAEVSGDEARLNLESLIQDVVDSGIAAERDVRNTIAELIANAGTNSIQTALQRLGMDESRRQFDINTRLAEQELKANQELARLGGRQITDVDGRRKIVDLYTGEVIADLGLSELPSGDGGGYNPFSFLNQNNTQQSEEVNPEDFVVQPRNSTGNIIRDLRGIGIEQEDSDLQNRIRDFVSEQTRRQNAQDIISGKSFTSSYDPFNRYTF